MNEPIIVLPRPLWRCKQTYICLLAAFGLLHGFLYFYGLSHPASQLGLQLFMGFTLNVALLGWCYVDAEEKTIAISGLLGFLLLLISWIGLPWYFVRSRGMIGALKTALGFWLFGIWFAGVIVAEIICLGAKALFSLL